MFNILPFILIVGSLGVILVVIVKKFPQLSLLDVDSLPEIQEEKKKNQVLQKRAKKKIKETKEKQQKQLTKFLGSMKRVQSKFRGYVGSIEKKVMEQGMEKHVEAIKEAPVKEKQVTSSDKDKIADMLKQADSLFHSGQFDNAEAKYIAVIRLDKKNGKAYRGLVDVYLKRGEVEEAEQTCQFLLQLFPKDDWGHVRMADIAEEQGDIQKAILHYQEAVLINDSLSTRFAKLAGLLKQVEQYDTGLEAIEQAVELEPENPKYLDNLAELAILVGNKTRAKYAYEQLRLANPSNKKLDMLKQRIAKM